MHIPVLISYRKNIFFYDLSQMNYILFVIILLFTVLFTVF